ncbi:hypothetical protein PMAYCL1PPCAC_12301, partial [Pristionchus mayeri]
TSCFSIPSKAMIRASCLFVTLILASAHPISSTSVFHSSNTSPECHSKKSRSILSISSTITSASPGFVQS